MNTKLVDVYLSYFMKFHHRLSTENPDVKYIRKAIEDVLNITNDSEKDEFFIEYFENADKRFKFTKQLAIVLQEPTTCVPEEKEGLFATFKKQLSNIQAKWTCFDK